MDYTVTEYRDHDAENVAHLHAEASSAAVRA